MTKFVHCELPDGVRNLSAAYAGKFWEQNRSYDHSLAKNGQEACIELRDSSLRDQSSESRHETCRITAFRHQSDSRSFKRRKKDICKKPKSTVGIDP